MLKSMTGYGKGVFEDAQAKFSVEIKSVNNKFGEFNLRLPRLFNPLEEPVRKLLSSRISRGRVDCYITYENLEKNSINIKYNKAAAVSYHAVLMELAWDVNIQASDSTLLSLISKFPDVIEIERHAVDETDQTDELWAGLKQAVEQALDKFIEMRTLEGSTLRKDFTARLAHIHGILAQIEQKSPEVTQSHRARLKKRMEDALAGVAIDEARFLNEVAHFSDKSDISEEITRMKSHLAQFEDMISENIDAPLGRKLDFLTQEMAREANTMGSKSNFADLSKIVIDLKSEVEKIREQVQNIE